MVRNGFRVGNDAAEVAEAERWWYNCSMEELHKPVLVIRGARGFATEVGRKLSGPDGGVCGTRERDFGCDTEL